MKPGSENRKKTITAGALGAVALICLVYAYNMLFGGSSAPAPAAPVVTTDSSSKTTTTATSESGGTRSSAPSRAAAGVDAVKMASTSSSLDPTLDERAMLRTESLVYSGSGRNIFSAVYTPPPAAIVKPKFSPRPGPVGPPPPPPPPPGPPPPPPINLKFFGTAKRSNGKTQAFLLQGEDVYLAAEGDIVARKYKIGSISANNIQVTDLQNNNTQTLPRQAN